MTSTLVLRVVVDRFDTPCVVSVNTPLGVVNTADLRGRLGLFDLIDSVGMVDTTSVADSVWPEGTASVVDPLVSWDVFDSAGTVDVDTELVSTGALDLAYVVKLTEPVAAEDEAVDGNRVVDGTGIAVGEVALVHEEGRRGGKCCT